MVFLHAAVHSHTRPLFDYSAVSYYHCFIKAMSHEGPRLAVIQNQYEGLFTERRVASVYD